MEFNTELVEKFLGGTASKEEAEKVLNWFQTKKGKKYLETRFDKDALEFGFPTETPGFRFQPSKFRGIKRHKSSKPKKLWKHAPLWTVAASIVFLIAALSVLNIYWVKEQASEETIQTSVHTTFANEHRIISLTDDTRIRLNENSRIEILDFGKAIDYRTVNLKGEAFFEVSHNPSKPFRVQSDYGVVEVLGTAFNVKTSGPSSNLMIVAVSEGKVAFNHKDQSSHETDQVLEKDQVGFMNIETAEFETETMNVTNYLTWMHGRVVFNKTPFKTVLKQLGHIYQIENKVSDKKLYDLILTADFSERSLENVIETIAHSLHIEAEKNGNVVQWSLKQEEK